MKLGRPLLAMLIAAAGTCSAFAQDAEIADQAQSVASRPASPGTLKSAFQDHFLIGVAINRSIATGAAGRRGQELVAQDIALVKEQFNQIAPENDLKWQLIHRKRSANSILPGVIASGRVGCGAS